VKILNFLFRRRQLFFRRQFLLPAKLGGFLAVWEGDHRTGFHRVLLHFLQTFSAEYCLTICLLGTPQTTHRMHPLQNDRAIVQQFFEFVKRENQISRPGE
jgi:hypothetical protein